jgi:isopentenyl-diphosphate Delta-isomerase
MNNSMKNTDQEQLILVDENDCELGSLDKMEVHKQGRLHRAFSVFIFNRAGKLLLQQRSDEKYHSAGLWTNTCCSHPNFGEDTHAAVNRRLYEEMRMRVSTRFAFTFIYKTYFDNGLTEHELDHVYIGVSDELPAPPKSEAKDWKYMSVEEISVSLKEHPELYTEWFKICFRQVVTHHQHLNKTVYGA